LLKVFGRCLETGETVSYSVESGAQFPSSNDERHVGQSFRQYASRSILQASTSCIEWLLVFLGRSTSLLLCLLDASKHKLFHWVRHRKSKRFLNCVDSGLPRSGNPSLPESNPLGVVYRRTAVGLAPLGRTNNGW